jgi:MarR family transcriptional regulator, organic hydroperoxide resistance regulator
VESSQPSLLQRELRQNRPFASVGQEAFLGLIRTADHVRRELAKVIEPAGVTGQQYNVLRILRGAGDAGLPTLEIAERMVEHTPGITRLLDRLEAKHLVRRFRCPKDRRQMLCWITEEGLTLLAGLDVPVTEAHASLVTGMPHEDQERLVDLLEHVRQCRCTKGAPPHGV